MHLSGTRSSLVAACGMLQLAFGKLLYAACNMGPILPACGVSLNTPLSAQRAGYKSSPGPKVLVCPGRLYRE